MQRISELVYFVSLFWQSFAWEAREENIDSLYLLISTIILNFTSHSKTYSFWLSNGRFLYETEIQSSKGCFIMQNRQSLYNESRINHLLYAFIVCSETQWSLEKACVCLLKNPLCLNHRILLPSNSNCWIANLQSFVLYSVILHSNCLYSQCILCSTSFVL